MSYYRLKIRLAYKWIFAAMVVLLSGCDGTGGSDPQAEEIPIEGPNASAPQTLLALPPTAASLNDIVNDVILTRLDVVLDLQSTVGEIGTALEAIDGRIVTSQPGSLFLTVEVPRQSDAAALSTLATVLSGFPGIAAVMPGREASTRLLPVFVDAEPTIGELRFDHLELAKFPAAWNAGQLLSNCALNPVPLIIIDKFGALSGFGGELVATINREFPDYTLTGTVLDNGETHGWEVAAMAAAAFEASANTGAMPFSGCLNLTLFSVAGLTYGEQIDAIETALRILGPTAVVNYSLGFRDRCDGDCTAISIADGSSLDDFKQITTSYDRAWYALNWKFQTRDMWDQFIVTTAAGDETQQATSELYSGLATAQYNSALNYVTDSNIIASSQSPFWGSAAITPGFEYIGTDDFLLDRLIEVDLALNLDNAAASNVIMVGSGDVNGASNSSDLGVDLYANGVNRLSLSGTNSLSGSSLASPQVAGLVAYLWALDPQLRTRPMADTIRAITENTQTLESLGIFIDAYATVLSLDRDTSSEPPDAPVREAILDVNNDGVFNQDDLTLFANTFQLDTAPTPGTELGDLTAYSRFDLNGSGFIDLFSEPDRFDLDPENSTYLGAAVYGTVTLNIGTESITLDESKLTDTQILCYYAYSPLYLGDDATRSSLLPVSICKGVINSEIAFVSRRDGNDEIYVMNVDGSSQVRLTQNSAIDSYPVWSPDGSKIAFASLRDNLSESNNIAKIYVMNADGTNQVRLNNANDFAELAFDWSPDSSKIVFSGRDTTYVINADGSNLLNLRSSGFQDKNPDWSPDGSKIVFEGSDDGGFQEIFVMNADGSNQINLTQNNADDVNPVWSPDGSKIAFVSYRDGGGSRNVYVMNMDGSNQVRLTQNSTINHFSKLDWSPDSLKITYYSTDSHIYIIDANGLNQVNLTNDKAFGINKFPVWSPDGSKIVFVRNSDIYVMNADGTNLINLTNSGLTDKDPVWSPL